MNKKKVAIITNIPSPYRVDFFHYLIKNCNEFEFKIIYSSKSEDNRSWSIDEDKIKNSIFLKSKTIKLKKKNDNKYIHITYDIIKYLNKMKPDIIVASEYNPTVIQAFLWAKINKKSFVSWSDGTLNSEKNINSVQKILRKLIINNSDSYIASSSKTKEAQIKYGAKEEKIYISYLTVDIHKYLYERKVYNNNLLYVGSLIKRKGVDLLLNALKNVKSDYNLIIIGEGPEKESLIKQSIDLKINDKVKFLGFKEEEELREYYIKSDIFILPTREDCFGLVTLEAMCSSMAILTSKYADGCYDLVSEGENGFIIDPYNEIEFANQIEDLLNDKGKIKKMAIKSYEKVDKFTFKKVSEGFLKAINL